MTPSVCALLAEYNCWMNRNLYDATGRLSPAQIFEDRGAFFGSLFDTLNHICVADTIWLHRFTQHPELGWLKELMADFPMPTSLRQRLAQSLPELREYREKADAVIHAFAASITDAQLDGPLRYANLAGQAQATSFRALVLHFFNHQTHHRGQATTLLFQAGIDVGPTDLIAIVPSGA